MQFSKSSPRRIYGSIAIAVMLVSVYLPVGIILPARANGHSQASVLDLTGGTSYHYGFFGENNDDLTGAERDATDMYNAITGWGLNPGSSAILDTNPTKAGIKGWFDALKSFVKPGEEVVFYFAGHGSGGVEDGWQYGDPDAFDPVGGDEPDWYDNTIQIGNDASVEITDDELAQWLSGFPRSVTFVIILDSCFSGTFADGAADLGSVTDADGNALTPNHLALIAASKGTTSDDNSFTQTVLLPALEDDGTGYPWADWWPRDGIVTALELYELVYEPWYYYWFGDNDGDGLIDEDGIEQSDVQEGPMEGSTLSLGTHFLRIDNDQDGLVDEDLPPRTAVFFETTMHWKSGYPDYAPSGVPDFDQRQDNWVNPVTGAWSWCGPVAVANSLWWMDSRFEPNPVPPPTINDGYPLLTAYGPWDDHDPRNLAPFASNLAWLMDTDGMQTGFPHSGTIVWDMQWGINQYLIQQGLYGIFYEHTIPMPTFEEVEQEVERCEDVILLLGFWQEKDQGYWERIGGHYVTVAGVDSTNGLIALSDPTINNAEPPPEGTTGPGRVLPGPHGPPYPHSTDLHNGTRYVSHDMYMVATSSPSPGNPNFGLPDYDVTYENFVGQNFDPFELGEYDPNLPVFTEVEYAVTISPYDWYFKGWPEGYIDYALNGMPDFDQKQWGSYNWTNPYPPVDMWSHCGPVAIANSLWWLDSQFEPDPVPPPEINDNFPLVQSYDSSWDDHDPKNVMPLVEELAYLMDTDGIQTGDPHCGTSVWAMQAGIEEYLRLKGLDWKFYEHTVPMPDYELIVEEVEKSQDVTLLLGFWQFDEDKQSWYRIGGHYVTVAGVDPSTMRIAISDPIINAAEWTGYGHVAPPPPHPHSMTPPHRLHNNASYVSHDIYQVGPSYSPGGMWGLEDYWVIDELGHVFGSCQNFPEEWLEYEGTYDPSLPISTEIEYAVIVSCETGIVAAGCEDTNVYVWDFFGTLQWQWAVGLPVVSVAMDNDGRFIAAGTRAEPDPGRIGDLWLFDNSLGGPLGNILWMKPGINVSVSYDGGWMGTESKSVDVKYNTYNGSVVVAAATDQGLYLFDEFGNQIWHYSDGWAETIARISQDGNYIVSADHLTDEVHYFSHLTDGVAGWGPNDGRPVWNASSGIIHDFMHLFWTAISGLGDFVAVGGFDSTTNLGEVFLLNKTGGLVWTFTLPKGKFVRVDMPCHGRSVVAVNDDPTDSFGCDLVYFSDGGDGWDSGDGTPVWSYWPGKEVGSGQHPFDDFYTVAISENGDYIATGGIPPNTYLLTKAGVIQQIIPASPGSALQSVDLTFTGKYGASGDFNGVVWFFDKDIGLLWSRNTDWNAPIHSIAVSKIYPCMFPFPDHDLAVTDVTSDKVLVAPGGTFNINVTVTNEGDYTESFFDVCLEPLCNGMPQQGVNPSPATVASLASGASTTITFTWNTTGLPEENYTLIAKASIVQDEIDVYDNTFVNDKVEVATRPNLVVDSVVVIDHGCTVYANDTYFNGTAYYVPVEVTVENVGVASSGSFNVSLTVYWINGSLTEDYVEWRVTDLNAGENTTLTYNWRPTHTGYYNLTAVADCDSEVKESNEADNTFVLYNYPVALMGDVNGNGLVDIMDAVVICLAWGATPSDPQWNICADLDHNGLIDIMDAVRICLHWGQTW